MLAHLRIVKVSLIVLYLIFALIVKIILRISAVNSLFAVRVIEGVFFAAIITAGLWVAYFSWSNENAFIGLISFIIDASLLMFVTSVAHKNISFAKTIAS